MPFEGTLTNKSVQQQYKESDKYEEPDTSSCDMSFPRLENNRQKGLHEMPSIGNRAWNLKTNHLLFITRACFIYSLRICSSAFYVLGIGPGSGGNSSEWNRQNPLS